MAKTGYVKTELTGGGASALDGISGVVLLDKDFAFVGVGNLAYFYILNANSGAAEDSPNVIAPDTSPGNKRWILQNYLSVGFTGTSATSLATGVGSKTLTVETNKGFVVGMSVKIADSAAPATNWMHGDVTAYTASTGVLVVNVTTIYGSGTKTAWTVSLSSPISTMLPVATAESDFILAAASPFAWVKKTLLEVKALIGLVPQAVGFTIAGGTTSKTLTVSGDATISATPYTPSGTDVAIADGGTGQGTAQAAIDALTAVSGATNEHVLTKDTVTGNAKFKAAGGVTYASAAEINAGTEAAKAIAPDQLKAAGLTFATTKMLFYMDTAPLGWTLLNTLDDMVVYVTKGSAAGGQIGGAVHSAGTWTQPTHAHTGPSHAHSGPSHSHSGPSHTHSGPSHAHSGPSHQHSVSFNTSAPSLEVQVAGGPDSIVASRTHVHAATGSTGAEGTGSTGAEGTGLTGAGGGGATGAGGTGATGAEGTGSTSAGATADTWRPAAYNMIICSKN